MEQRVHIYAEASGGRKTVQMRQGGRRDWRCSRREGLGLALL